MVVIKGLATQKSGTALATRISPYAITVAACSLNLLEKQDNSALSSWGKPPAGAAIAGLTEAHKAHNEKISLI